MSTRTLGRLSGWWRKRAAGPFWCPETCKTQVTAARSWLVPSRRSGAWTSWSTTPPTKRASHQASFQSVEEISDEEWELTFRTNIHAMFYLCRAEQNQAGGRRD